MASVTVPELPEWNETMKMGGNPKEINVNLPYTGLEFEYIYQVIMGMLVLLIVPGIGLLYGGMARKKSALAMIFQSMTVLAVCTFQWMFWGFSLAFSRTGGPFIGDLSNFGLMNVRPPFPSLTKTRLINAGHGCTVVGQRCHP
jgi:ammonium transporter, Amt family